MNTSSRWLIPKAGERPESKPPIPDHELMRRIGEGAYGEVWLARNVLGTCRAIKIVYRTSFREERTYEREFRGIQQFEPVSRANDGLLNILQAGRNDGDGYYYYVMELADDAASASPVAVDADQLTTDPSRISPAVTMEEYSPRTLQSDVRERGRLPPAECVQLGLNVTLALGHLHRHGLIHRDIKPANIIFLRGIPKLADIGLVTTFDGTCSFVGTEGFIAPEGPTSPRADLFSLGKVLYEISTGKDRKDFPEPPTGLGESNEAHGLAELNAVILRACATDPSDRYQTAEEFHADLALLNSGKSVLWKRVVEKRLAFARKMGVVVAIIAALMTGGYLYQRHQTREAKRLQRVTEDLAARMQLQNAENLMQRGDSRLALAHLAAVLRRQPGNRVAAERILAALGQRSFPSLVTRPLPHKSRPTVAHFSRDAQRVVSGTRGGAVHIWDARSGAEIIPAQEHSDRVNTVEFSPDGSQVLTASSDGTVRLLNAQNGSALAAPLEHQGPVMVAMFDPTGRFFATVYGPGVRVYHAATGQLKYASLAHPSRVRSIDFSANGRWLASGAQDGTVRVWDVDSGAQAHSFAPEARVELVRFSRTGELLAAVVQDQSNGEWRVQLWDWASSPPQGRSFIHDSRIHSVRFSPDNRQMVTAEDEARVWDLASGQELFRLRHRESIHSVGFSPDGRKILTASVDGTARLWDAITGASISEPMLHYDRIIHAEFSPDGKQVLTASWDRTVKVWAVGAEVSQGTTIPHGRWVPWAQFNATGDEVLAFTTVAIYTASRNNRWAVQGQAVAGVWDAATGSPKFLPTLPKGTEAIVAQFTEQGPFALVAKRTLTTEQASSAEKGFSNSAQVWDLAKGGPRGKPIAHSTSINAAEFSPDGAMLATGATDGSLQICELATGRGLALEPAHQRRINTVRFSANNRMLVTASDDRTARIWNSSSGKALAPPLPHLAEVWFAQFSPTLDKLLTISLANVVTIWSTNGVRLVTLPETGPVEYGEFSPDGMKVLTAAGDGRARVWNARTGQQLIEPLEHASMVLQARFSGDGFRILTVSKDQTGQLWDAATGLKLADPWRHGEWVVSGAFSANGRRAVTAGLDGAVRLWEVPSAGSAIPSWLADLAEAVAGQRLTQAGVPESVPWTQLAELKRRLKSNAESKPHLEFLRLIGFERL